MADHTVQQVYAVNADPLPGGFLASPRQIILLDIGVVLDASITHSGSTITFTGPTSISLAWFIPSGTSSLVINTNYPVEMDVSGSRPKAEIKADADLGIAAATANATSGGGDQTITLSFSATPVDGTVHVILSVPDGVLFLGDSVTFEPLVQSGQAAAAAPGKDKPGGGAIPGVAVAGGRVIGG